MSPHYPAQKKDVLYLKRTPTVTYDLASGRPIPEAIKKYYIQQQLPVRKQSLAANNQSKSELKKKHLQPSSMRHMSSPIKVNTALTDKTSVHVESATPTSPRYHENNNSCPSFNLLDDEVEGLAIGSNTIKLNADFGHEDEDDEFDFKDRPPSSVIRIKPMDPNYESDEEEEENEQKMTSDPFAATMVEPWNNSTHSSTPISGRRKGSIGDLMSTAPSVKVTQHDINSEVPLPQEESDDCRLSSETVFTDISDLATAPNNQSMTESYSSIFLSKMQLKREEQQKSIDAYRSQHATIYTALLSEVAKEFHRRIVLSTMVKDGIEYHEVFNGKEAIDRLLSILCTNDRLEAIEVGRALKDQNFFHHVNYEPIFADSADELYAFRDLMNTPKEDSDDISELYYSRESSGDLQTTDLPNGIYTDLADCYSPTCTGDNFCYSWSCLRKKSSKQSQHQFKEEDTRLWSQSVPENIVEATLPEERKRQECIYELIYTEQDFVRDLEYIHEFWVEPLLSEDIIADNEREEFVKQVFYNIADVRHVNTALSRALELRQAEKYLVSNIGDIMLEHVQYFQPFVDYGAHQIIGKFTFELEKKRNPLFASFVEETERKPESRRLELNGYLTKPTTRLGRYNLLLREILKRTPDDNPDKEVIPQIMNIITTYLEQVNIEAGKCENFFNLQQIGERLEFKSPADYVDLKLEENGRQLLMKGRMKRKGNSSSEASDLQVFLFDHYLVLAKIKYENHLEIYRTYRRPIPLELLSIHVPSSTRQKRASSILPYSKSTALNNMNVVAPRPSTSEGVSSPKTNSLSITFIHHGRKGSPAITLFTSASSIQQIWIKKIMDQKALMAETRNIFTITPLVSNHFAQTNRVTTTASTYDENNLEQVLVGTDQGVYITKRDPATKKSTITRIISIDKVSQIELMPESQLLVLADKTLWTFPLDVMAPNASPQAKRGRPVCQNTTFFHVGECLSKTFVCVVQSNTLSDTIIRVLEPVIIDESKKSKSLFSLKRLVRSGPVGLKGYKDLYLPSVASSVSLLKLKMCISSPKEIGVVDMKNFGVQALLDPEDEELGFVFNRQDVWPVTIYKIQFAEFLVCYNEFAFFVDQRGRFIKSSAKIVWEGAPDSFALSYPYLLAFEPDFIEIRNVHTGALEQIIRGKNIRCTSSNTHNTVLQGAMDDPEHSGFQLVFQLDKITRKG